MPYGSLPARQTTSGLIGVTEEGDVATGKIKDRVHYIAYSAAVN